MVSNSVDDIIVRSLNDNFRKNMYPHMGRVVFERPVLEELHEDEVVQLVKVIQDSIPDMEELHECGLVSLWGIGWFWNISYYSPEDTDKETLTTTKDAGHKRLLTIGLCEKEPWMD